MTRLVDIARELRLDVSVVSRALNPKPDRNAVVKAETRARIRDAAARMGYRPNRQAAFLKKGGDATLLCYLPGTADRLVADLMFGISEAAAGEGFPLTFFNGRNTGDFSGFLRRATAACHSGLLTYPPGKMDDTARRAFDRYLEQGGNVLMLNAVSNNMDRPLEITHPNLVRLDIDDAFGAALAAEHLAGKGCRQVRCVESCMRHRTRCFAGKARELGMTCRELDPAELPGLVKTSAPVGIFTPRDADGLNMLNELMRMGFHVGKNVLLVSFDDLSQCVYSVPSLSSVHQPTREEGRRAVEKLVNMIFGRPESDETVRPYLMVRESSGGRRPDPADPATETVFRGTERQVWTAGTRAVAKQENVRTVRKMHNLP
ncbi:MAG: LacI family DNA-binding transcriptional regulator [Lentisphaeria bacterium]|nr:LacI family DNA-binding transcriptional regulator [Lentisphaeria bacterium]